MSEDAQAPEREIIIKKIKPPPPPPHGGAWKVAYADFVTAMMAFFLLLWLLNASVQDKLDGISNYFLPIGAKTGTSGGEGVFGGTSATDPGPTQDPSTSPQLAPTAEVETGEKEVREDVPVPDLLDDRPNVTESKSDNEAEQFKAAEAAIQQALDDIPELRDLHEAIKIDITDECLKIQLIDQQDTAMFKPGGAELNNRTKQLLLLISSVIERLPNKLQISGHTDSEPFRSTSGKTNWELSLDRANTGRRVLEENGIPPQRFDRVTGFADRIPLIEDDPASPRNRRLIILLQREDKDRTDLAPTAPRIFRTE